MNTLSESRCLMEGQTVQLRSLYDVSFESSPSMAILARQES